MGFQKVARWLGLAAAAAALLLIPGTAVSGPQQGPALPASGVGKYNGPGGCAASNCHGSVKPKSVPGIRISQNEFSIWATQDKHARAYAVLSNPVSQRMGKILKIEQPNKSEKCLVCHALYVPPDLRATTFQLDDGVSCENCHGPAVGWLGPHTTEGWQHYSAAEKSKYGMYDTRDLVKRSEKCMTCHVGAAEKQVDHEMIAAGHPDLTFELDSFSAAMPRHWKVDRTGDEWIGVQSWAIGQAVQLRESLQRLSRRAASPTWPDYAELDCFACHHSLTAPSDSWRLTTGGYYQDRRPGVPAWNSSRYIVFRSYLAVVDPQGGQSLNDAVGQVSRLVAKWAGPQEISAAAQNAAGIAEQVLQTIKAQQYSPGLTARIMLSIASDSNVISEGGERAAEQAAMALDTLSIAYTANAKLPNEQELRAVINNLFAQLRSPSGYNASQFQQQLQKVQATLPHTSSALGGEQ